ncbi:prepilin peptidase [Candidatus Nomurabacteria bacterium]|nr:prepilin peptidase [Candidatus Nomurabacteria bacterium]
MSILIASMALLGLAFGSFAGAMVWRLRARQLVEDKRLGIKLTKHEKNELKQLIPLAKTTLQTDRSRCLHCGHILSWYDLLPLLSWISTGGRCRYCKKPIGWFELVIELGVAISFATLALVWGSNSILSGEMMLFVFWAIAIVLMAIVFAYDIKWLLIPSIVMYPLIVASMIIAAAKVLQAGGGFDSISAIFWSVVVFSGIYLALYLYSRWRFGYEGTWVGFGDVELGLALGLLLGNWQLSLLALFLANLLGILVIFPSLVTKKRSMKAHVPFGPLMIVGFAISLLWGESIIDWYLGLSSFIA